MCNGGVQCKFVILVLKSRLVTVDSLFFQTPTTAHSQTLAASFKKRKFHNDETNKRR